jgi:hypothetical protein
MRGQRSDLGGERVADLLGCVAVEQVASVLEQAN